MLLVIVFTIAGIITGFLPEIVDVALSVIAGHRRSALGGYSTRELRRITASVLRRDRRRGRYGLNA